MSSILVRHEPASAALVRHRLVSDLQRRPVSATCIDEVALVVSELLGNAILHTTPSASASEVLTVSWELDDTGITVTVRDASSAYPHPRESLPDEPGGRGLAIIEALSDSWGVHPAEDGAGKGVWAHLPMPSVNGRG